MEKCVVWPRDIVVFGEFHRQRELRDKRKAQSLYDVYTGQINDADTEIYAQLIEEGYVIKTNDTFYCNTAVSTAEARELFGKINAELAVKLSPLCRDIRENIGRIVKSVIPGQLSKYAKGYTETWILFYSYVNFFEALYNKGFITIPEKDDKAPMACYIYEK